MLITILYLFSRYSTYFRDMIIELYYFLDLRKKMKREKYKYIHVLDNNQFHYPYIVLDVTYEKYRVNCIIVTELYINFFMDLH